MTLTVFAYGSNMPLARIRERCPSARPLGVAELRGYELRWHKRSRDGSGKCDVIESVHESALVYGVLYEIAHGDKVRLDQAEGLGIGYEEIEIEVLHGDDWIKAFAYRATDTDPSLKPYSWYQALVVAGAREHGLPNWYVSRLESVRNVADPDLGRHEMNMRLIGAAPR